VQIVLGRFLYITDNPLFYPFQIHAVSQLRHLQIIAAPLDIS